MKVNLTNVLTGRAVFLLFVVILSAITAFAVQVLIGMVVAAVIP